MTPADRLKEARRRLYVTASDASAALGMKKSTYEQYENGTRGISRVAERLALFFRVDVGWLLTGKTARRAETAEKTIPLRGIVGAGSNVDTRSQQDLDNLPPEITVPTPDQLGAFRVKGDSQYPRFLDGDHIVFRMVPRPPGELVNQFALVETADGRSLIKRLRYGRRDGTFNLESFNAETEENIEIDCAYEHVLTIPGHKGAPKPATPKRR